MAVLDSDIFQLNQHREELESALHVLFPDAEIMSRVLNKETTYQYAQAAGLKVPTTVTPECWGDVEAIDKELKFPVVIKWSDRATIGPQLRARGQELKKVQFATHREDLLEKMKEFREFGAFPMVQEYCRGPVLGQMVLAEEGRERLRFQHLQVHEFPCDGGNATICRGLGLHEHGECWEGTRALLKELQWTGPALVEYRYDAQEGTYTLLEVNGRFWGSQPLAFRSGVHFAHGLLRLGTEAGRWDSVPVQTRTAIFLYPEIKGVVAVLRGRSGLAGEESWWFRARYLGEFLSRVTVPRTIFYVFWWRDPWPSVMDSVHSLTGGFRRAAKGGAEFLGRIIGRFRSA
ncbi:hypothetical protein ACNSTU_12910 [Aquisalimonas sp. APHAB1-3]|uniref:hypothetical protein n=1 Tax=Aquisalimonas sp. APHAB1-3 TaxID=3402080 RepID=UPI003AAE6526